VLTNFSVIANHFTAIGLVNGVVNVNKYLLLSRIFSLILVHFLVLEKANLASSSFMLYSGAAVAVLVAAVVLVFYVRDGAKRSRRRREAERERPNEEIIF